MNLNGKIVTVFGGSGFIGKYVVRELALAGYTVRIVNRSPAESKFLRPNGFVGQVVPAKGNIRDYDSLQKLIAGSYAVVNLVGILFESGKQRFDILHAQAPEKLAQAARAAGVEKFVHMSALVPENSKSKYAASKLNGEKAVTAAFPDAVIIKPSVVFGAEDNFFNKFAAMSSISPVIPVVGGRTRFQPVYVGDVALAIKKAVDENVKPGAYQLGGPEALSFNQIIERVLQYTGRKRYVADLSFSFAKFLAIPLPACILTADQVRLLEQDNLVTSRTRTLTELGIKPTAIESVVPKYLARMKRKTAETA